MHNHNNKEEGKESVALSSVFAGAFLTASKLIVGVLTNSIGIISEAIHSLLDFISAILTFFAVKFGDRPADDSHPYGHGKIESVSAFITTGLLFFTSGWIIYEAIHRLVYGGREVEATWYAFAVIIVSIVIDISRSRALLKVAKKTNSQALEADALHFTSDVWSSLVVLLGLVFVSIGFNGADAIAAICVALFVMKVGYNLGKRTIDVLVDAAPEGSCVLVRSIVERVDGVIKVERVRVRPIGSNVFIDILILINRKLSVSRTQEIIKKIEESVHLEFSGADIVTHAQPIQLTNETVVESIQALALKKELSIHDIIVDEMGSIKYVSYHLELPEKMTVEQVHRIATELENDIREEFGGDIELNTHIEPLKEDSVLSEKISSIDFDRIMKIINDIDGKVNELKYLHNILIRKMNGGFFVSLHCISPRDLDLESAHEASNRFEYLIREQMSEIKRVVVHIEPEGDTNETIC